MQLSYEKISHLSNLIVDGILKFNLAEMKNRERVYQEVKRSIINFLKIVEGSREWEVMYKKFYEEEMAKRK